MSDYQPQPGDRVSLTGVVTDVGSVSAEVDIDGLTRVFRPHVLTLVERLALVEKWQAGDIVRNADDPEDKRTWQRSPFDDDVSVWVAGDGDLVPRGNLPDNLRLLVRDGQPVPQPEPVERCEVEGCTRPVTHYDDEGVPLCAEDFYNPAITQDAAAHPQPGDVVTDEPPIGSVVRDPEGDVAQRDHAGWWWVSIDRASLVRLPWIVVQGDRPGRVLKVVRWGAEQ